VSIRVARITDQRSTPYTTVNRSKKCREETCTNVLQPPLTADALRKTGRCNDCALKYAMRVIRDLLDTDAIDDSEELLVLSAIIATKVVSSDLSNRSRRQLVNMFRDASQQIEAEKYADASFWRAFLGVKPARRVRKRDENV